MDITEAATVVAALATATAGLFAGFQVLELRRDRQKRERAELDGVAVSWEVIEKPSRAAVDGSATWLFHITAHNPGTLPIRNVEVDLTFPHDIRRLHYDGHVDDSTRLLNMGIAVLVGGSSKTWKRRVRMAFDETNSLREMAASITFVDMDGRTHVNLWSALRHRP